MVAQILILSRRDSLEFKPIRINSVIKEAIKMLRSIIPTSIDIQENICHRPLIVYADATQLHQVIVNLATNARHAMIETGGVLRINVDSITIDEGSENNNLVPGSYVRIMVSDTGSGINKDHMEKIFEPYFTTKGVGEGSGLGLSVVHGIIKSHQGDISVHSEPGKGTTFYIYLPLSEQQPLERSQKFDGVLPPGSEHILLVDDEKPIVKMQRQLLERLGYKVTASTSSVEALKIFRSSPYNFDLVITDMTMPDMSGDYLAKEIKKIRPDVLVILCTGYSERINIQTGAGLQIDGFMMKPIEKGNLAKTVRKLIDEAKMKS